MWDFKESLLSLQRGWVASKRSASLKLGRSEVLGMHRTCRWSGSKLPSQSNTNRVSKCSQVVPHASFSTLDVCKLHHRSPNWTERVGRISVRLLLLSASSVKRAYPYWVMCMYDYRSISKKYENSAPCFSLANERI